MFSGIIEELGIVRSLEKTGSIYKLQVLAPMVAGSSQPGQSICVNGVCLTVVKIEKGLLWFEIIQETIRCTNLGLLRRENRINLERALRVDGRYSGHFVTGHIDGIGTITKVLHRGQQMTMEVKAPDKILGYMVLKGPVALDGVSLTISALRENSFQVNLIPYTLKNTTLGLKKEAAVVNIECDILAKYMEKIHSLNKHPSASISSSFLKEQGFI